MKGSRRLARRAVVGALAVLTAVALALGLGTLVPRAGDAFVTSGPGQHEIVVLANAIHTDIALPATPEILERFAFLREAGLPLDRSDVGAILVGWGGRVFYTQTPTWGDLTASAVLASATRDRSVMHVALAPELDPDAPQARRLVLSDAAYAALLAFIEASFTRDEGGVEILLADAGYTPCGRRAFPREAGRRCRRAFSGRCRRAEAGQSASASRCSMSSSDSPKWWPISWIRTWLTIVPSDSSCSAQ